MSKEPDITAMVEDVSFYVSHTMHQRSLEFEASEQVYLSCHMAMAIEMLSTCLAITGSTEHKRLIKQVADASKELAAYMVAMVDEMEPVDNSHMH